MSTTSKAGIQTDAKGTSYIPASKRSDGSTRKEIRVRPGYRPPEDVETYKNQTAEAWKNRGSGGVPGAEPDDKVTDSEPKSKNAKRRDAARRKAAADGSDNNLTTAMKATTLTEDEAIKKWQDPKNLATDSPSDAAEVERQKKIRNVLKKLNAVRDLRQKKTAGEKLSPDQLVKISKEDELIRDLKRLGYQEDQTDQNSSVS
jgi:partner of Y14 and mago